ncbi:uncharacterized protein LOC126334754 isoform X2 [Schistocerca gregaria]|uniref:uncharacterized protein LOC126334754 isoform X1 n=1 Tax=Schistocerca gregaria TaxID=7010 RepID=UPI00211E8EF9|nr:uncharacterized protein LOC126334754 isoform X1 [Schistocerca gregaria]XP_049853291.1 uncharacterized protein LOC126334754 isoform X2 [Schistocerca gregaria]
MEPNKEMTAEGMDGQAWPKNVWQNRIEETLLRRGWLEPCLQTERWKSFVSSTWHDQWVAVSLVPMPTPQYRPDSMSTWQSSKTHQSVYELDSAGLHLKEQHQPLLQTTALPQLMLHAEHYLHCQSSVFQFAKTVLT